MCMPKGGTCLPAACLPGLKQRSPALALGSEGEAPLRRSAGLGSG